MTLIINNNEVAKVLTMEATIEVLEESYKNLATGEAVCRPRIDIRIPTPAILPRIISGARWRAARRAAISRSG